MGDGGVGEGNEEYYELTVNESPEALGECESIHDRKRLRLLKKTSSVTTKLQ